MSQAPSGTVQCWHIQFVGGEQIGMEANRCEEQLYVGGKYRGPDWIWITPEDKERLRDLA